MVQIYDCLKFSNTVYKTKPLYIMDVELPTAHPKKLNII